MELKYLYARNLFSYSELEVDFSKLGNGITLVEGVNNDNPDSSNACVIGSTLVSCPCERDYENVIVKIQDLVGKEFYVYSYDIKENKFVVRAAYNVRKTGDKKTVWKLKYGNSLRTKELIATPDHRILLDTGEYKEVQELNTGDAIRTFCSTGIGTANLVVESVEFYGYEDIYDMEVEDTHNFVANGIVIHNSGKTSLFEIINWCLFDDIVKAEYQKDKDKIIRHTQANGEATLIFSHNGIEYEVNKKRSRGKTELQLLKADIKLPLKTTTEVKKYLEELIGINFSVWKNSIILGQNTTSLFLSGTNKDRSDLLGCVLDFDLLNACLKHVRENLIKNTTAKIDRISNEIEFTKGECIQVESTEGYKTTEETTALLQTKVDQATQELQIVQKKYNEILEKYAEEQKLTDIKKEKIRVTEGRDKSQKSLDEFMQRYETETVEFKKSFDLSVNLKEQESEQKAIIEKIAVVEDKAMKIRDGIIKVKVELEELQERKNKNEEATKFYGSIKECPYCGQVITEKCSEKFKLTLAEVQDKIDVKKRKLTTLSNLKEDAKNKLEELRSKQIPNYEDKLQSADNWKKRKAELELIKEERVGVLTEYIKQADIKIDELNVRISNINSSNDNTQELMVTYENDMARIKSEIARFTEIKIKVELNTKKLKELTERLVSLNKEHRALGVKLKSYREYEKLFGINGVRNYLIEYISPYIENSINSYLNELNKGNIEVKLAFRESFSIDVYIDGMPRSFSSMSGGEGKLLSILFNLALSDFIYNNGKTVNWQLYDEMFDNLDTENSMLMIELLNKIAQTTKRKFFLITHSSFLKDIIEKIAVNKIVIQKNNGISTI